MEQQRTPQQRQFGQLLDPNAASNFDDSKWVERELTVAEL